MKIYCDGAIDDLGYSFDVAVTRGCTVEFDPQDGFIFIVKDGERRRMTYEVFDNLFYILNETMDAALKEDCIFYRVVDGCILLKNHRGEERLISMERFFSMYQI